MAAAPISPLTDLRVMVVEDELLIAMLVEDTLTDHGCIVVGPFSYLAEALEAAGSADVDFALLDVNLRGEKVYPVALTLARRGIPFLLLSGYGGDAVPPEHPDWRALSKPFDTGQLIHTLSEQLLATSNEAKAMREH